MLVLVEVPCSHSGVLLASARRNAFGTLHKLVGLVVP